MRLFYCRKSHGQVAEMDQRRTENPYRVDRYHSCPLRSDAVKKTEWIRENRHFFYPHACEVLLAAHLPSKQDGRVRDPSHALIRSSMVEHPAVNRGVEGSRPSGPAYASVAQRRQQLTVNQPQRNTGGSSPPRRTYLLPRTNNRVTALSRRRQRGSTRRKCSCSCSTTGSASDL